MDNRFQIITALSVAALAAYSLYLNEVTLAATCVGILGGILVSPLKREAKGQSVPEGGDQWAR